MSVVILERPVSELRPYAKNPRSHSHKQIKQIAASIKRFGFNNPILISDADEIIAGHGRAKAAELMGLERVPTIKLSGMTDAERRAYVIADNATSLGSTWNLELLAEEFGALAEVNFDLSDTGFSLAEADAIMHDAREASPKTSDVDEDALPDIPVIPATMRGDLWVCGRHKLVCGDSLDQAVFSQLLGEEKAHMVFTDPPYNLKVDGCVSGLGKTKHDEFAYASGEMTKAEFVAFLTSTLSSAALNMHEAAIAYVCMDWRHMQEMLVAGAAAFTELKNLAVWNKGVGGMGTFYRSQHELIFVFKKGEGQHTNNFGLGDTGRYRTNVWAYPAANLNELAMHPTVKPVALIADAIRDCSKRGQIILDLFGGSGTTLIAAEKTGRSARLIELDERYCDVIVNRWEKLTGKFATLIRNGQIYENIEGDFVAVGARRR